MIPRYLDGTIWNQPSTSPMSNEITETVIRPSALNVQAPVSKLPDELLSYIFVTLIPSWSSIGYYQGPTHWLARAISQVCFRWRQISLEISTLWRSIELNHGTPEWRNKLFLRASTAPFIEISSSSVNSFDEIIDLPDVLPRICFFDGKISPGSLVHLLNGAQHLDDLAWQCERITSATFQFPTNGAPPPRYLWMERTDRLDFLLPIFSGLRAMRVAQAIFSIQYLASVVRNIPFLERLEIEEYSVDNYSPSHRICIPCLRYLRYVGENILKYIDPPQDCMLDGFCTSLINEPIATFSPRLIYAHTHKGNPWLGIRRSKRVFNIYNSKSSRWGKDYNYRSRWSDDDNDKLVLSHYKISSQNLQILFQELISGLAPILPSITGLTIENLEELGWDYFRPLFCHLTAVQRVSIPQPDGSEVFPFLQTSHNDGSGPRILLPSLHTIHLPENCRWKGPEAAEFKSFLAWRAEQGAPITHIEGRYSRSFEDDFKQRWNCLGQELESVYGVRVNMTRKEEFVYSAYDVTIPSFLVDTT